jgi:hypothetical protein
LNLNGKSQINIPTNSETSFIPQKELILPSTLKSNNKFDPNTAPLTI